MGIREAGDRASAVLQLMLLFKLTIQRQYAAKDTDSSSIRRSDVLADFGRPREKMPMVGPLKSQVSASPVRLRPERQPPPESEPEVGALGLMIGAPLLCEAAPACGSPFSNPFSFEFATRLPATGPPSQPPWAGNGQVKVGLILPLSASGNAGVVGAVDEEERRRDGAGRSFRIPTSSF